MKLRDSLLAIFAALLSATGSDAAIILSDFSDLEAQYYPSFTSTWHSAGDDQFIQNVDFISITTVNAGNPQGMGGFDSVFQGADKDIPTPYDFSTVTHIQLTARLDTGNTSTSWSVEIYDANFNRIGWAQFFSNTLNSDFSSISATFHLDGDGDITTASFWNFSGDGNPSTTARISLDHLVAIPEPASLAFIAPGLVGLGFLAARRRNRR